MIILKDGEQIETEKLYSLIGKINGIIYARVSTSDQAEKGHSLESQVEKCKNTAIEKFGIKEDEIITLVEAGGMGDDPNRPALNYALYLLEKGLGKKLIILHPDRLARDNTLQGVLSRKIWNLGVDLEYVEFTVDPTNPESMLMYNIQGSISQYNKAKILANSKRGRIQKAKKGEIPNFKRLYGYIYDKEIDKLIINEEEKGVILKMVNMLLHEHKSCNQIAKDLSKRGVSAPNGDIWYQTTVSRILKNEDYTGIYYHGRTKVVQMNGKKKQVPKPKEEWIEIPIPQIIDKITFESIQKKIELFSKNKGRKSKDYLLKGIAKCGRCGAAAGSGITSKVSNGTYKYYACRKKASKGYEVGTGKNTNVCKGKNWRVDLVDQAVWSWVVQRIENPDLIIKDITDQLSDKNKIESLNKQQYIIEEKIQQVKKEENNYIILFGKEKISEEQFDALVEPLKENLKHLRSELDIIIKQIVNMEQSENQMKMIMENISKFNSVTKGDKLTMEHKRRVLSLFVERVQLNEDDSINIMAKWHGNPVTSDIELINLPNQHKNQNHRQAYGRQTK
ncbi:recombinase family protein [Bacillus sp. SCS-151]|uniref:recombinase family protein n=1 Tax=Nanhaiella sioensis TaxID=3115293 RepID=UPI00397861DF